MSDTYKHGVLWQDHQHQQLLAAIASLNRKRETALESLELNNTLSFLAFYVKAHFDLEEHYMEVLAYPGMEEHKKQHAVFRDHVKMYTARVKTSKDPGLVLTELCNWLQEHILGVDHELAEFIKQQQGPL